MNTKTFTLLLAVLILSACTPERVLRSTITPTPIPTITASVAPAPTPTTFINVSLIETAKAPMLCRIVTDYIGRVNVRDGPGMEYTVLATVPENYVVTINKIVDGWYYIDYNGTRGYISNELCVR